MKHILKTWPEYFKEVESGNKTFDVRKDDRDFNVGDQLELLEYDPDKALDYSESIGFTGKSIIKTVTYKLNGGAFGIEAGYCVLGLT